MSAPIILPIQKDETVIATDKRRDRYEQAMKTLLSNWCACFAGQLAIDIKHVEDTLSKCIRAKSSTLFIDKRSFRCEVILSKRDKDCHNCCGETKLQKRFNDTHNVCSDAKSSKMFAGNVKRLLYWSSLHGHRRVENGTGHETGKCRVILLYSISVINLPNVSWCHCQANRKTTANNSMYTNPLLVQHVRLRYCGMPRACEEVICPQ